MLSGAAYAMPPAANYLYQEACSAEYKEDYTTALQKLTEALAIVPNDVMIYTKLAGVYSEMGEYEKALEAYAKVAELKPADGYIYVSVGSIYENQGKYKEALDAYNKVMEMCPEYIYNYLNIANVNYQLRDYKSAIENYNKFLAVYSQHKDARENLAASYVSAGEYQSAVNEYENLYAKNPSTFKDYANYGFALYETKKYDKAIEFLEKAVDIDPENVTAHIDLAQCYQEMGKSDLALGQYDVVFRQEPELHAIRFDYGNLLAQMGKDDAAIANYKIYISKYPEDYRGYQNIGIVYKRSGKLDETIENYKKALELRKDDRDIELVEDLAECYHIKKDYQNAIKYYDEVLVAKPDNYNARFNRALVLHATGNYNDAIAVYNTLLQEKDNLNVHNNLAAAYVAQGDKFLQSKNYTLSIEMFEKAINLDTKDSYAYFGLAKSYRACNLNDKATEFYEKAIAMSPEKVQYSNEFAEFISATTTAQTETTEGGLQDITLSMDSYKAGEDADNAQYKDLIAKGDENYNNKNYDISIKNYQEALKIKPADEVTLLKIGNIYKLKEDNRGAISFYKKSIVVNPNYTDGWFNLGLAYANEKNNNKAKECFHRVVTLNPNYGYAYYALAMAYEKDGNKAEALNNYKIFLTHNNDEATFKSVQEKIKELEQ